MKATVVSPWYPDYAHEYSGVFVQKQVTALRRMGVDVEVEVPQVFPAPSGSIPPTVSQSMRTLSERDPTAMYRVNENVTYIPTPVPSRSGHMGRARAFLDSLRLKRALLPSNADITHAHLGVPTGWATASLGDRPFVVTEHQSTLGQVLADPASREAYAETISLSSAFICVSETLKDLITQNLGAELATEITVVPNVVDLEDIPFRERSHYRFSSWIYVGGVAENKGIRTLVKAFALHVELTDPDAELTIVGDGPLMPWVERFAESRKLRSRVRVVGQQPHSNLHRYLSDADVMVHLSPHETFGIASLEAIGAGIPVISLQNGGTESTWGNLEHQCGALLDREATALEVAESVSRLKDNPERLDLAAGREMVKKSFSFEAIGRRLIEIYEGCRS